MAIRNRDPARRLGALAATGLLVMSLTACGDENPDAAAASDHNGQDVEFLQEMIPHHREAVDASETLLVKEGVDTELTELAGQIRDDHQVEFGEMTAFLGGWDEPIVTATDEAETTETTETAATTLPEDANTADSELEIPDLGLDIDLTELREAPGREANLVFIELMIDHLKDAVDDADRQAEDGRNTGVIDLATTIQADREEQIGQMERIRQRLQT